MIEKQFFVYQGLHIGILKAQTLGVILKRYAFCSGNAIILNVSQNAVLYIHRIGVRLKNSAENRRSLKIGTLV